jgi:glycosyltransferase involved in cell wall biosynthesis
LLHQGLDEDLFEIIIVNDGSTDHSRQLINDLAKQYRGIRPFHTINRGLGVARNVGIKEARGKYLFFVDSDDYLFDHSLATLFQQAKTSHLDIIGFDWQYVYENRDMDTPPKKNMAYHVPMSGAQYLATYDLMGSVWRYLFLASFLKKYTLYMPEGIYHEDELFLTKAFMYATQLVFVDELIYAYYQRHQSITNSQDTDLISKRITDHVFVLHELLLLTRQDAWNKWQEEALERKITFLTVDFIINLIRLHLSRQVIEDALFSLRASKLYPLPKAKYSLKYRLFRIVFNYECNVVLASKLGLFTKH